MSKKVKNAIEGVKRIVNTLDGDAREFADAIVGAIEELEADAEEHNSDEILDRINALAEEAKGAASTEEVAERIQAVKNEIVGMMNASKSVKDAMTPSICKEVANAIANTRSGREAVKDAVKAVLRKNDISDMSFDEAVKIAVSFESKSTELFDSFGRTDIDKVYLVGIDEEDADQIAKQWTDDPDAVKEVQELAAEGITISTKYIYKKQRMANEAIDDAREHGTLAAVESETARELEQQVKRLAEKAAIVGDNVNSSGKAASTFQTIGTTTSTTSRIAVVNPAGSTPTLLELATTADKVDAPVSEKVCVISKDLARQLSEFLYGQGGSQTIISDEQIASQIGVSRLVKVDYLSEVDGLHAVVLKPSAYKVRIKNEVRVAYPWYQNNSLYYLYELNMGGALAELKSAAVLRDASASSSK